MGLDAESTDLTARIQARRRALVLDGSVEPSLPGEHVIHGKQPGAHAAFETSGASSAVVAAAQEARRRRSETVVEMDYTDFSAPEGEEAPEPEADEPEFEFDPEPADVRAALEYAERVVLTDSADELRLAGIEAEMVEMRKAVEEVGEMFSRGLVALATGISVEFGDFRDALAKLGLAVLDAVEPEPKRPWWRFWRA